VYKKFYRSVEEIFRQIDDGDDTEQTLRQILHRLVEDSADEYGIESGRLYRERTDDFLLIESVGEYGESIEGKTVSKSYAVLDQLRTARVLTIGPDAPGYDPATEDQFSRFDSAAVLVGESPSYILSFGIRRSDESGNLHFILETLRTTVGLKLRQRGLEDQLRQARQIQMSLLPRSLPKLPGFEFAARSIPAEEVGGDVYDMQTVEDGVLSITIGDASGHGLPAALQARDVMTGLRMGAAEEHKISTTVQKLNRVIHQSGLVSRFVSLFYAELEETGSLSFVNGGHCPPLLFGVSGRTFELPSNGPVLGPLPDAVYRRSFAQVEPGELLILFTDGLIERVRPQDDKEAESDEFGVDRLAVCALARRHLTAQQILDGILEDVFAYGDGAPWADDVTLMIVRRLSREEYEPKTVLDTVQREGGHQHMRLVSG
jgi:sigma-B regulation protein RsbU (phosphoserine phosphatase)